MNSGTNILAQGRNPWEGYDRPGKGNGRPIVPEPSQMALVGILTLLILLKLRKRK